MADAAQRTYTWFGWTVLSIVGLVSLACLATGGSFYGLAVQDWADHDYVFKGFELISWVVGLLGGAIIAAGLLIAGVFLRFLPLRGAPLASLALAAISAGFLIATFLIFSKTDTSNDSIEVVILQGLCIIGLFVLSLPPFLHWLLARRQVAGSTVSPKGSADAIR